MFWQPRCYLPIEQSPSSAQSNLAGVSHHVRTPFGIAITFVWVVIALIPFPILILAYNRLLLVRFPDSWPLWAAPRVTGYIVAITIVAYAIFRRGFSAHDYLALKGSKAQLIGVGVISQLILTFLAIFLPTLVGFRLPRVGAADGTALFEVLLWTYVLVYGLVGPICEEILFRGFMYRGWAQHLNPVLAISLSSVVFALVHFDNSMVWHFVCGVLFGWLRWRFNSIWAPVAAHTTSNLVAITSRLILELS